MKSKTYEFRPICSNCKEVNYERVPKGTNEHDYMKKAKPKCDNCGCKIWD